MGMRLTSDKEKKKPLYIDIYDQLLNKIVEGIYAPESQLPGEHELAKSFGVSRMTLRQALSLLQDDGLVKSIHGKGHFVKSWQDRKQIVGMEKVGNPMYSCHSEEIDEVELMIRLDVESDHTRQVLNRRAAAVVALERWYKSKNAVVGYGFTYMAIETVSELSLDLKNKPQLLEFLEKGSYDLAHASTTDIKLSTSLADPSIKYKMVGNECCNLLLESLYLKQEEPLLYNKYYIPSDFSCLRINAFK